MANDLTKDVLYVDTAAAIYTTSQLLGKIVWSEMSSGDQLKITDADGMILYQVKASVNNDYFEFDFDGIPRTLTVDTIGSGVLILHPFMPKC